VGPYGFFFGMWIQMDFFWGNVIPDGFRNCIMRNCSKS
jgi:hypothetical protein